MQRPVKVPPSHKRSSRSIASTAIPEWLKEIDFGRSVENLLMGAVLYAGRFFATQFAILFRPRLLLDGVLSITDFKDTVRLDVVRPLQLFALSGFFAIAFSQKALGGISFVAPIFDRYPFLSALVTTELKDFSLAKTAGIMIPLTLVVALYAYLSHCCALWLKLRSTFRQHLSICAYVTASLFFSQVLASNFEMHVWGEPDTDNWLDDAVRPLVGLAGMLAAGSFGILAIFRYLYFLRFTFEYGYRAVLKLSTLVFIVFWVSTLPIVLLIDPFLQTLK